MKPPRNIEGTWCLITGASSGIGRALAFEAARHRMNLLLVARRGALLDDITNQLRGQGVQAEYLVHDLTTPHSAQVIKAFAERHGPVSMLINNAGYGWIGDATTTLDTQLSMIDLNIRSLTELTLSFAATMKSRHSGIILNIASAAAFQPVPLMSVYAATKAYVLSFSSALSEELRQSGVHITAMCPGPVNTEFSEAAGLHFNKRAQLLVQQPGEVARRAFFAALSGKAVVTSDVLSTFYALCAKFLPRAFLLRATHLNMKRLQRATSSAVS